MEKPEGPSDREPAPWMNAVAERLKAIEGVVKKADPVYQPILYGRLLEVVIEDARGAHSASPAMGAGAGRGTAPSTHAADAGTGRFGQFLGDYSISLEALGNVVDLESGIVLTRNLGSTKAEKQRRLAALLALVNAHKLGNFFVGREELVRACDEHAAFDTANFARYMKGVVFNGAVVFTPEADGYKVSRPGEAYIAEVVKGSLSPGGGA
jgi:hypothetical protein